MTALHRVSWAALAVVAGMEVVVLNAVPSPVHDDLEIAAFLTVGAFAIAAGVTFGLSAMWTAGQSGPSRHNDGEPAPNGIPPWAEDPVAATLVDLDAIDADEHAAPTAQRNWTIADHWAHHDPTGESPVVSEDTQLMLFRDFAELVDEPQAPEGVDVPPSQRDYAIVTTHLAGVAAQLQQPAAWDMWNWRTAA